MVSRSSAEAEYRALASLTSEVLWISLLLRAFEIEVGPTMVFCDSNAAIHLAFNPSFHERFKHIKIYCHFTHDRIQGGTLHLVHVKSAHQPVDLLTKLLVALSSVKYILS